MQHPLGRQTRRRHRVIVTALAMSLLVAACGSDDDDDDDAAPSATSSQAETSSSTADGTEPTTAEDTETTTGEDSEPNTAEGSEPPAAGGDIVAEAQRIDALALEGLVWAPTDSDVASSDIVAQTEWLGPEETPAPPSDISAQILICAPGTACETAGQAATEAADALGWTSEVVAGAGTPESFTQAFETALSKDPDVILSMAVPDVLVGDSLAQAREQGVVTISVGDVPSATTADAYDAYVSFRMPLMHQLLAYHAIAETGGQANVILINDSAFPNLVESNEQFQAVMDQCAECTVQVVDWQITDALDPVAADTAITAALQDAPDATHLVLPYSIGISAVIEAVRKAGKTEDVKVMTKDGDELGLLAVANGGSSANAGVSLEWVAWAGLDQAIRGLTDNEYLPPEELGLGAHLFNADNVPEDGIADWAALLDYKQKYLELWGLGS